MKTMYEDLFNRNKKALAFIKEQENISDDILNSLLPIERTNMRSKTIVGIADLMTKFAEKTIKQNETIKNTIRP